jgi:hypothetical protein
VTEALPWAAASLAVLALGVGVLLLADAAYGEAAVAASRRLMERGRRRSEGEAGAPPADAPARRRAPALGLLGRGAPVARRQLTELMRKPAHLVGPFALPLFFLVLAVGARYAGDAPPSRDDAWFLLGSIALYPLMFSGMAGFDFRRDLDRMPYLRSLPLSPVSVAVGQVFTPALVLAAGQVAIGAAALLLVGGAPAAAFLALAAIVPPLTWAALAVDNILYLLLPFRVPQEGDRNPQFMGRVMLIFFLKLLVILVMGALGALAAWMSAAFTDSLAVVVLAVAGTLALVCIPLTWGVAAVFATFDVGTDTPP